MDDSHAAVLLGAILSEYKRKSAEALAARVGLSDRRDVRPPSGARFDVEVIVECTDAGVLRVTGRITDGRGGELRRAFLRLADGQLEYVEPE